MFADNLDEMDDSREVVQQLIDEYHAARYKLFFFTVKKNKGKWVGYIQVNQIRQKMV